MRIFKSHPLLKLVNSYVVDSPQPSNISYLWNFGSLLAFCLVIQIITGVTLAMHYNPSVLEAFNSVEHIMRDVNNGWLIRYLHSNTASAFFFIVYLHIGRGLYYGSYRAPRTLVWTIGTVIFILMMANISVAKLAIFYGLLLIITATTATSFVFLFYIILSYIKAIPASRVNILKGLVIISSINFCLRFPMSIFCEKLGIMYFFYIWCGFVACICYMVISNLKEKDVITNRSLFIMFFFYTVNMWLFHSLILGFLLVIMYNFIPDIWEAFTDEIFKYLVYLKSDIFTLWMLPPQDPNNQLTIGYNPNATNQPIGRNIATELQQQYADTKTGTLSGSMMSDSVQRFVETHLQANDPPLYDKLQLGRTPGQGPKWWNLSNTRRLRDGLNNLI